MYVDSTSELSLNEIQGRKRIYECSMFDVHAVAYKVRIRKLFLLFPSSSIFAQRVLYPFCE